MSVLLSAHDLPLSHLVERSAEDMSASEELDPVESLKETEALPSRALVTGLNDRKTKIRNLVSFW